MADVRYAPLGRMTLHVLVAWSVGIPSLLTIAAGLLGFWPLALISAAMLLLALSVVSVVRRVAIEVELRAGELRWSSLASSGEVDLAEVTGLGKWSRLSDVLAVEAGEDTVLVAPGKGLLVLVSELRQLRPDLPEPNVGRMNTLRERLPGRSHVTAG